MVTMKQAQQKCSRLREKGDRISMEEARRIESMFKDHPNYEDDQAWLLRMQAGPS